MCKYEDLKNKWSLIGKGDEINEFNYELLSPGKFCVHISDAGGIGSCWSEIETTGFF